MQLGTRPRVEEMFLQLYKMRAQSLAVLHTIAVTKGMNCLLTITYVASKWICMFIFEYGSI